MGITKAQLDTWSHQGAVPTSKMTYATIKAALDDREAKYHGKDYEIYLQGSYGNDTNIYAESDVDVVIQLNSTFHSNKLSLPPIEFAAFEADHSSASYHLDEFRADVIEVLKKHFGSRNIEDGRRAVKVHGSSNRRDADVVVCSEYRCYDYYKGLSDNKYESGIMIKNGGEEVINYPKLHSKALTSKHQETFERFKPLVRIIKNIKTKLVDLGKIGEKTAPSYFLEGWLYNAPSRLFCDNITTRCFDVLKHLLDQDASEFIMPHGMHKLIGDTNTQWSLSNYKVFKKELVDYWDNWGA